ncbi:hypothetical protein quinque_000105 [Culex quinquefasciatus]
MLAAICSFGGCCRRSQFLRGEIELAIGLPAVELSKYKQINFVGSWKKQKAAASLSICPRDLAPGSIRFRRSGAMANASPLVKNNSYPGTSKNLAYHDDFTPPDDTVACLDLEICNFPNYEPRKPWRAVKDVVNDEESRPDCDRDDDSRVMDGFRSAPKENPSAPEPLRRRWEIGV